MGAWPGRQRKGRGEPGASAWGAMRAWGPADGACSSSSRLLGRAHVEREEGVRGRNGGRRAGEADRGGVCVQHGTRRMGTDVCVKQQTAQRQAPAGMLATEKARVHAGDRGSRGSRDAVFMMGRSGTTFRWECAQVTVRRNHISSDIRALTILKAKRERCGTWCLSSHQPTYMMEI
jgi:hypothetical protein